jgi:hypothetical protein
MSIDSFHQRARNTWVAAIKSAVGPNVPFSSTWTGASDIARVLAPIMGRNNNHTHLPGGGGLDMVKVLPAVNEKGCLEFYPSQTEAVVYLMKPKRLTLEFIEDAPGESFFHLELQELQPSGAHPVPDDDDEEEEETLRHERLSEEVVDVGAGQYVSRSGWDEGVFPDGRDLPSCARLVVRQFGGAAMAVAKGSIWNGDPSTYDGRHSRMTPRQIRHVIERSLPGGK